MPVCPKVEWTETETTLNVCVTLRRPVQGKDVGVTDAMLKINVPPFLLVVDFYEDVDAASAKTETAYGGVKIHLRKVRQTTSNRHQLRI